MPKVYVGVGRGGKGKKEKFRCKSKEESDIIEKAKDRFREEGHDIREFVINFFGVHSSNPNTYVCTVKGGSTSISLEAWEKLNDYVSKIEK